MDLLSVRQFSLFAAVLIWISACIGCGVKVPAELPARSLAMQLESETVALVRLVDSDGNEDPNGSPTMYCAGVWVSPSVILTAAHCMTAWASTPEQRFLQSLGLDVQVSPVGLPVLYAVPNDQKGSYWTGKAASYDPDHDLAAIYVPAPRPPHEYARLSTSEIDQGDRVEVLGHPAGYVWSYAEGVVSATRAALPNPHDRPIKMLQIAAPFSHGNSGSGVFDRNGYLIGIGSWIDENANGMAFFIHRDVVRVFLHSAGLV